MLKRPLNFRFNHAVLTGRKISTIRDNPWPYGKPIMLYNWSGKAYRSPQINIAPVQVVVSQPIEIHHLPDGTMKYDYPCTFTLWECEGFDSQEDMDNWFRAKIKPGKSVNKTLIRFRLLQ